MPFPYPPSVMKETNHILTGLKAEHSKNNGGRSFRTCIIYQRYLFFGGDFPVKIYRVMHELLTPRYRATSAPEYPSSLTANEDRTLRAFTTSLLRLPDRNSPIEILWTLQTLSANLVKSILLSETSLRFSFAISSLSDRIMSTKSPSPNILWS